ncbi:MULTISPECIES: protein kinase domain-containing protein [Rhodococcus]|uniref:non-specific serine/threonine protein kinase n=1 Tax=Rhodococcus aetherivorans TaxID=191292 RepID=N1M6Y3_9NOCA|nr:MULTISPECIES: protein kinase [Rhodococcus]AKE89479.1 serine/threonine protein kinase [Rhodococcus aetherivorans]ANZ25801.1 serine/threonine protein kinase [Rhodococcus sp. WB1]MBC2590691.1 protein kinase [Rhodococcus aetherivorans]MDV6292311.1 protein kinase [Rhodococcus aetherivorans]NGP27411.1 protein kinase [Rhodococcus aetherivorans]
MVAVTGNGAPGPGSVFAGYTIERLLGAGGMGSIYLAQHPHLPRKVALKLLHPALTADDSVKARFELEADHAARLEHANIVQVYDRGCEDGRLWIAMQYVPGTNAAALLGHGPVPPERAVHIVSEIGKALDYAHQAGVLHRDVKPTNILLAEPAGPGEPERVLLTDFGIAKALDEAGGLTRTGMFVGSLQNAAPEQFDTTAALDHRTDIYSLGCTLYHLLTGRPPYSGDTLAKLWHGHVRSPIPRPSEARPDLPKAFDAVVAGALAKDRNDRYDTCRELTAAARNALTSETTTTVPAPAADDTLARTVAVDAASPSRVAATRRATRRGDSAAPLRVVLADDSVLLREGIARLLCDEGIDVVGEAGDAATLLGLVADERPDVAVVDIRMPPTHTTEGIVAAAAIRADHPDTAVVLLSQYVETDHVMNLLADGAAGLGYLLKDRVADIDEFVDTLHRVAEGGSAIDPSVVSRMVARPHRDSRPIDTLSTREREVLSLMAEGRSNRAIGAALFLGERTVEAHVRAIFLKLGLHPEPEDHRRVLAVLKHLEATTP